MTNTSIKVAVGMSGGVDSSVVAYLLKQKGYDVFGIFMKNWEEKDENGECRSKNDYEDVAKVCEHIGIPYYSVNFCKEYEEDVFSHFLEEIQKGFTPNPDILCNREIKFKALLNKALSLGADFLATGHYASIQDIDGVKALCKGLDTTKDQSYFLYTLKSNLLEKILFPLGNMEKKEVRKIAREIDIPVHSKKDSTGICFIGKRNFKNFLHNYIAYKKGSFIDLEGKALGEHQGSAFYTIGQRKGLGIGGPGDAYFVASKDIKNNTVTLAQGSEHPALFASELTATDISFVGNLPIEFPIRCKAKIRYRQVEQPCTIEKIDGDTIFVCFDDPQRAITLRQSIVFYMENICLGGAMIASIGDTLWDLKNPTKSKTLLTSD